MRRALALLFVLAGCSADPLVRACAPLDDAVAYANCRLGELGRRR